jgi:hypothetical protein
MSSTTKFPGRVGQDIKEQKFYVLADACILKDQRVLTQILIEMRLPSANTAPKGDSHYMCPGCRKNQRQREEEEANWDF